MTFPDVCKDTAEVRVSVDALGGKVDAARETGKRTLSATQRTASDVEALRRACEARSRIES